MSLTEYDAMLRKTSVDVKIICQPPAADGGCSLAMEPTGVLTSSRGGREPQVELLSISHSANKLPTTKYLGRYIRLVQIVESFARYPAIASMF